MATGKTISPQCLSKKLQMRYILRLSLKTMADEVMLRNRHRRSRQDCRRGQSGRGNPCDGQLPVTSIVDRWPFHVWTSRLLDTCKVVKTSYKDGNESTSTATQPTQRSYLRIDTGYVAHDKSYRLVIVRAWSWMDPVLEEMVDGWVKVLGVTYTPSGVHDAEPTWTDCVCTPSAKPDPRFLDRHGQVVTLAVC